jgi:hypothetical protein
MLHRGAFLGYKREQKGAAPFRNPVFFDKNAKIKKSIARKNLTSSKRIWDIEIHTVSKRQSIWTKITRFTTKCISELFFALILGS